MGINLNVYSRELTDFDYKVTRKVGIYLPRSVFIHGQLYVALSRVKRCDGLQFALAPPSKNSIAMTSYTNNVCLQFRNDIIMVSTIIFY